MKKTLEEYAREYVDASGRLNIHYLEETFADWWPRVLDESRHNRKMTKVPIEQIKAAG